MNLLKKINGVRRAVMRKLTRNLGVTRLPKNIDLAMEGEIRRVLICRPNHRLGNLLLITPLLQEVTETLPQARIDLFVKGNIAPILFQNYPGVRRIIQLPKKPVKAIFRYLGGWFTIGRNRYDLVINVVNHSSSGKIATQFANARFRLLGDINEDIRASYADHEHMAKYPVYSFRNYIRRPAEDISRQPVPEMDLKLTPAEIAEGKQILEDLVKNEKPTICIYTYATGAKCYGSDWWQDFYQRLSAHYPEHNIIEVLPIENVSQINFRAPSFYSKDLRQIGSLIANTEIFIGADSGMMHLASAVQVPTLGLFKAQNMNTYAPYNKRSFGVNTDHVNGDELVRIAGSIVVPHRPPAFAAEK